MKRSFDFSRPYGTAIDAWRKPATEVAGYFQHLTEAFTGTTSVFSLASDGILVAHLRRSCSLFG